MNRLKKFLLCISIFAVITAISGCGFSKTDKDVKNVIALIDEIGEITLESREKIQAAFEAYSLLSDAQKEAVENYDKLTDCSKKCDELEKEHFINNLDTYSFINVDSFKNDMDTYWDRLNDTEKEQVLVKLGECSMEAKIEARIKKYLKSPNSFTLYDYEYDEIFTIGEKYATYVKLRYGATNSYGAEVTDDIEVSIRFVIDIATKTVEFTEVDSVQFWAWDLGL